MTYCIIYPLLASIHFKFKMILHISFNMCITYIKTLDYNHTTHMIEGRSKVFSHVLCSFVTVPCRLWALKKSRSGSREMGT